MQALNVTGAIALVALTFYLGWALMGGADDRATPAGSAIATPLGVRH